MQNHYAPFDGYDTAQTRYPLVSATNKNIKAVYLLFTEFGLLSQAERVKFAKKAGVKPVSKQVPKRDALGKIIQNETEIKHFYEFENIYTNELTFYAALAQKLFIGFPKLIQINEENEAELISTIEPSADDLRLDIIKQAYFFLTAQFSLTPTTL